MPALDSVAYGQQLLGIAVLITLYLMMKRLSYAEFFNFWT